LGLAAVHGDDVDLWGSIPRGDESEEGAVRAPAGVSVVGRVGGQLASRSSHAAGQVDVAVSFVLVHVVLGDRVGNPLIVGREDEGSHPVHRQQVFYRYGSFL